MPTSCLSVLQIIRQYAPREWRTNRSNFRSTYTMKCPLCEHEPRGGNQPNYFTVTADEQKWHCHVHKEGRTGGNAYHLLQLLTQGHNITAPQDLHPDSQRSSDGKRIPWQGATVKDLTRAKGLPLEGCQEVLGWKDARYRGGRPPVVKIPYPDENNRDPLTRYRVGISGDGARYIWEKFAEGQRSRPYGLGKLAQIRERGYVILVEGETDCASLMYSGLPVLGTPGNYWNKAWNRYVEGIRVYVWQEPDFGGCNVVPLS